MPIVVSKETTTEVLKTVKNITYYVSTTGSDTANDGLTVGAPFKTIQHAIDIIPQIVNHTVTINVASGTYDEGVRVYGFIGKGLIYVLGDTSISTSRVVNYINVYQCTCGILIKGLNPIYSIAQAIYCDRCTFASFEWINITSSASTQYGIFIANSNVEIMNSTISNRGYGIVATQLANVKCTSLSGTGNVVGIVSNYGSVVSLAGTELSGTTMYSTYSGLILDGYGNPKILSPITMPSGLLIKQSAGEGGKFYLEKSSTSTLVGNVVIDSYASNFRIFDGGNGQGAVLDIKGCGYQSTILHTGIFGGEVTSIISADVTMTNATTWYDSGASLTLSAGTWLVWGQITMGKASATVDRINARIYDSTTTAIISSGEANGIAVSPHYETITLSPQKVSVSTSSIIKLQGYSSVTSQVIKWTSPLSANGNTTYLCAMKIT